MHDIIASLKQIGSKVSMTGRLEACKQVNKQTSKQAGEAESIHHQADTS